MYPNVRAEMARRNVTLTMLGDALHKSVATVSGKIKGNYPITIEEAKIMKTVIGVDMSLDELFATEE